MRNKEEKAQLYAEYQKYIGWIVKMFLLQYPRYKYLQDDLIQECALRFCMIIDDYDPQLAELTTFLSNRLTFYMSNYIKKEISFTEGDKDLGESMETKEVEDDPLTFEELIAAEGVTPLEKRRLRMYFVIGYTTGEIAKIEDVTADAVVKSIASALQKIKAAM